MPVGRERGHFLEILMQKDYINFAIFTICTCTSKIYVVFLHQNCVLKFSTVLLQGLCVHVCMCGEGRLRGRLGGIVGGARRKREGTHSCNFHNLYGLVTVLYRCFISADDPQRDGEPPVGIRQ